MILEQLLSCFLLFSFHGPLAASKGNILSLSHYAMGYHLQLQMRALSKILDESQSITK